MPRKTAATMIDFPGQTRISTPRTTANSPEISADFHRDCSRLGLGSSMLVTMNPFHGPTASRAELASYYVLLALQISVHRVADYTGGIVVKLDGTREPRTHRTGP